MSKIEKCVNPYKSHFWRLPDLKEPISSYEGNSKDAVIIFPIFQTRTEDIAIEHHIVRTACWARRSWLLFSDVQELDIAMKFYVETKVHNRVIPILRDNYVDVDKDVLYFDGIDYEGEPVTHLGKKMAMFNDKQFSEYEWVIEMDSDNFLASPDKTKYPFFERELDAPLEIRSAQVDRWLTHHTIKDIHWWQNMMESKSATDMPDEKIKEWDRRARLLANSDVVDKFSRPGADRYMVAGGIYSFPAKHFFQNRQKDIEWIAKAGKLLQDDEAVFSLWRMNGNAIGSIADDLGMNIASSGPDIQQNSEIGHHYMCHFGSMPYEHFWHRDTGIDVV